MFVWLSRHSTCDAEISNVRLFPDIKLYNISFKLKTSLLIPYAKLYVCYLYCKIICSQNKSGCDSANIYCKQTLNCNFLVMPGFCVQKRPLHNYYCTWKEGMGVKRPLKRMKEQLLFSTLIGCALHSFSRQLKERPHRSHTTMDLTGNNVSMKKKRGKRKLHFMLLLFLLIYL